MLNTNGTLTSKFELVTKGTSQNSNNVAIKATLQMGYMFATSEEKAEIKLYVWEDGKLKPLSDTVKVN